MRRPWRYLFRMQDDDGECWDGAYPCLDEIDFARTQMVFRSLVLFDDVYLNMQAMNLAINDSFITDQEYALLREYVEIERTPAQQAMFVSAQSQMSIFALYELLRTWRQRIRKLRSWSNSGAISEMLKRLENDKHNLAALMRAQHIVQIRDDPSALDLMEKHVEAVEPVFRVIESIRINHAKHEVQGKPNLVIRVERMLYEQSRLEERAAFGVFADRTRFGIIQ